MNFRKYWRLLTAGLLITAIAACANPEESNLPTQAPIAAIKDENENDQATETQTDEAATSTDTTAEVDNDRSTDDADEESEPIDDENLAALPRLDQTQIGTSASGVGGGFGGGGAETAAATGIAADAPIGLEYFGADIFENTEFILNAELPDDHVRAVVEQQTQFELSLEEVQAIADKFGFNGPIYRQPLPEGVDVIGNAPYLNVYYLFDENGRSLIVDRFGVYYNDSNFEFESQPSLDFESASQAAEAFLQSKGLLDFNYIIQRGWGNEVWIMRTIRGAVINQPEITVGLTNNGEVIYVSKQQFDKMERLGNYPLRSAADAWQLLQSGVVENQIPFNFVPDFDQQANLVAIEPVIDTNYQYWQRRYEAGDSVTLFIWPNVFVAASGDAPPRIEAYPYILTGEAIDLEGIANEPFSQLRIDGVVSEDGRSVQVTAWESILDYPDSLYLQGQASQDDSQILFTTEEGETYILPDTPEDLPLGEKLNIFAWTTRDSEANLPILEWESIDLFVEFDEAIIEGPAILDEPQIYQPTTYERLSINNVDLIYFLAYIYPEYRSESQEYESPKVLVKPVWRFTGEADTGEVIEFFVDAVAAEYLE